LTSCFWNSHQDKALEATKEKLEADFIEETRGVLSDKPIFQKKYATTILNSTTMEIIKDEKTDSSATLSIKVKTVPPTARQSLREILAKQNQARETNFNTAEALTMIYQQLKLSSDSSQEIIVNVQLKKTTDWEVTNIK
jgi:hypothetical protein